MTYDELLAARLKAEVERDAAVKERDHCRVALKNAAAHLARRTTERTEARAIADEQAVRSKFCSRCKPVPRPWAKDDDAG
jgi:hypothetical protein